MSSGARVQTAGDIEAGPCPMFWKSNSGPENVIPGPIGESPIFRKKNPKVENSYFLVGQVWSKVEVVGMQGPGCLKCCSRRGGLVYA